MAPFFSVIIPTFNCEATIKAALQSILTQSFKEIEIIIVDGISTDRTMELVDEQRQKDERIKIMSEKDEGVYDAMNKGIRIAKGDWLLFLGSDDVLYDDEVLTKVKTTIKSYPKIRFFYGDALIVGKSGWGDDAKVYDGEFTIEKLIKKNICHQAIFYNKEVFKKCGNYDIKYRICADHEFNQRISSKYEMKYLGFLISKFKSGGLSTNINDEALIADFERNLVKNFFYMLHKKEFKYYISDILIAANDNMKTFNLLKKAYLHIIVCYHNVRTSLLGEN